MATTDTTQTDLRSWATRLRQAADAIDRIFLRPGTPAIARQIGRRAKDGAGDTPTATTPKRRRMLTAAERQAIGRRTRAAWRRRKAAAAAGGGR